MAVDEQLGRKQFPSALLDLVVDVRRPAGVRNGLDGPEIVLAGRTGHESAEPLEVRIASPLTRALSEVNLLGVTLPDLDGRVPDRFSARRQDAAGQVRDLAHGRRNRV